MTINLDSHRMTIPCPHCGEAFQENIGRLKQDPQLTCPTCDKTFTVDAHQLRAQLHALKQTEENFGRELQRIFKQR